MGRRKSAAWCFTSARWITLKSGLESHTRQRAGLLVLTVKLRILFSSLWFVQIVICVPLRYSRNNRADHTTKSEFLCVVSYSRSASANYFDQYLTGFIALSGCCCNRAQQMWKSHASGSSITFLLLLSNTRSKGNANPSLSEFIEFSSALLSRMEVDRWSLFSLWSSRATRRAKVGRIVKRRCTVLKARIPVRLHEAFNPGIAFVVWDETPWGLGRGTRPK